MNLDNSKDSLYFVALIPPPSVQKSIRTLQEEVADRFHSKAALKSPPHITLMPPLSLSESGVLLLREELQRTSQPLQSLPIVLEGFAVFAPRVLYIQVQASVALCTLQAHLSDRLQEHLPLKRPLNPRHAHPFVPHITLGFRDLSVENFKRAWADFQQRSFHANFIGEALTLLQHNGQHWEAIAAYPFTGTLEPS